MFEDLSILLRVAMICVFAGFLGWEREEAGKSAGLRTHILVGISAVLFVMIADALVMKYRAFEMMRFDPIRIVEAVITGISFLGTGMIIFRRGKNRVQGLTTAAGILTTAAIGTLVGLERYFLAAGSTAIVFLVLRVVNLVEVKIMKTKDETDHGEVRPESEGQ
jgi:putative Mg2+ transporter-C (MgtC) family protein